MHPGISHLEEEVPFYSAPKGTPGLADIETLTHQVDQISKCSFPANSYHPLVYGHSYTYLIRTQEIK